MGCGVSKLNVVAPETITIETKKSLTEEDSQVRVEPVQEIGGSTEADARGTSPTPSQRSTASRISIRAKKDKPSSGKSSLRQKFEKLQVDSRELDEVYSRGSRDASAISKASTVISADSGIMDERCGFVTETSSESERELAAAGLPEAPDLLLTGTSLLQPRKTSSATSRSMAGTEVKLPQLKRLSTRSLSSPSVAVGTPPRPSLLTSASQSVSRRAVKDDEGLSPLVTERPASRGGVAFDIHFGTPDTGNMKRTPSKLKRLESQKRTKSDEVLRLDIEGKIQAAEQRRKLHEQSLLQKLEQRKQREEQTLNALIEISKSHSDKTKSFLEKRMESNKENREAHLKALRDKLHAKNKSKVLKETTPLCPLLDTAVVS